MKNKLEKLFIVLITNVFLFYTKISLAFATNIGGTDVSSIVDINDAKTKINSILKNTVAPIAVILGILGLVYCIIVAGLKMSTAEDPRERAEAMKRLGWGFLGLLIVSSVTIIIGAVLYYIGQAK